MVLTLHVIDADTIHRSFYQQKGTEIMSSMLHLINDDILQANYCLSLYQQYNQSLDGRGNRLLRKAETK
jgi:hypothetical protein